MVVYNTERAAMIAVGYLNRVGVGFVESLKIGPPPTNNVVAVTVDERNASISLTFLRYRLLFL